MSTTLSLKHCASVLSLLYFLLLPVSQGSASEQIIIGLNAALSGSTKPAGTAIVRGAEIAIAEINDKGGVLGRPLKLITRDHHGNPARGKDNILDFADQPNLVAILGGVHTPVVLSELDLIHQVKIPYLIPWAAGTSIIDNGYSPNFVYRVSVRDEFASQFLLDQAAKRGFKRPCLLLENTGWGRSNLNGFQNAAAKRNLSFPSIQWFNLGSEGFKAALTDFSKRNCDAIMFVANAREGVYLVRDMAKLPNKQRIPIISHWGITGGNFPEMMGRDADKVQLSFLQTFSFFKPSQPGKSKQVEQQYFSLFNVPEHTKNIISPVGTAHAYDLVHLLARAIEQAQSVDRSKVRDALEQLDRYEGLVRVYEQPFSAARHDALDTSDFILAEYGESGGIYPVGEVE